MLDFSDKAVAQAGKAWERVIEAVEAMLFLTSGPGKKAVVAVEKLDDFLLLKEKAEELKISTNIVADAGHTEIPAGTETVLGMGPAPENLIDQVTGHLPTL